MQDYLSSGFAPSLTNKFAPNPSTNFAPNTYEQSIHMLVQRPAVSQPSNRREFISQQERTIRNGFLRKAGSKSASLSTNQTSNGTLCQRKKVNGSPMLGLKLAVSVTALVLVLFTGQLGCSLLSQQPALKGPRQSLAQQHDASKNSNNSITTVASAPTLSVPTATSMDSNTLDESGQIDNIIAVYRASTMAPKEKTQATQDSPVVSSDHFAVNEISTSNLVQMGYDKLRSGAAKESISLLSEAVRRDCNDPTSRRYLGYALIQAGRPAEALEQYNALQKLSALLPTDRLAMQHAVHIAQTQS